MTRSHVMVRAARTAAGWLGACLIAFAVATASAQPRQVHGSGDAFEAPGVRLAWAVERGTNDATTQVVIGLALDGDTYAAAALVSVDPFVGTRQPAIDAVARGARLELRIPRERFADFPRTELNLYRNARDREVDAVALVVYYVGVPDTTPEFADPGELDRYLAQRLGAGKR